ncbi:DUF2255 family protein [uncultured Citricoccus sp.]|uniref:DUF2255 family protein n=1 Tax=uncultured Citricoccus sp. TaxID=614031 RepID=UPI003436D2E0
MWSAVVDGNVYVRAYNGTASRWHRSAMIQRASEEADAPVPHRLEWPAGWAQGASTRGSRRLVYPVQTSRPA